MRIAIGQLWQETNTLNPLPTTRANFEEFGIVRGAELVEKMAESNELGGFIQSLRAWPEQPEIVGLARLPAWPNGTASHETFLWLREEIVGALKGALPVDGVLLALHGSLVSERYPDVEGEVLRAVRELIGPKIPLVVTLDLHANVTPLMVAQASAIVLYHTVPHMDVFETGVRGAKVLRRILADGARPTTAFRKLAMVPPVERANTEDPASVSHAFKQRLIELEQNPRVLSAGLATVQPWLDIPELGSAVVIVTDNDAPLAEAECARFADEVWSRRKEYFLSELVSVEDAVRVAAEQRTGLVVLSDAADATTAGAPGDSNWILRELLNHDWNRPALVTLVSPEVVAEADELGVGSEWTTTLGGVRDRRYSLPLTVTVRIAKLFDAKFVMSGHLAKNMAVDMGPSVVLRVRNVHIIVTSRTGPHFAPELFQTAGLDPFAARVVVAKSPCGFRAAYAGRAARILVVRAPGCAPPDFWKYPYKRIPRPMWPWDA